jgi:hypothetical protein
MWNVVDVDQGKEKRNKSFLNNVKNDYVRLLLTKTFQKNVKKNRKEILMDNILTKRINDVVC